jgi:hypothetical protein
MAFEITGKVIDIAPVNQVSDKFRKREFVIEKKEAGNTGLFIDYIKFQLIQDKCDLINESFLNTEVKVSFNLRGNKWERDGKVSYFTNLDAWKMKESSRRVPNRLPLHIISFPDEFPAEADDLSDLPF